MNCPHCQKPLPEKYNATYCLHCGQALELREPPINWQPLTPVKVSWFLFFGVLLAPAILTFLTAFLGKEQSNEQASPLIGFYGGAASGIACGILLAVRLGKNVLARIIFAILFSCILGVVSIAVSFAGCMAAGYKFRFE